MPEHPLGRKPPIDVSELILIIDGANTPRYKISEMMPTDVVVRQCALCCGLFCRSDYERTIREPMPSVNGYEFCGTCRGKQGDVYRRVAELDEMYTEILQAGVFRLTKGEPNTAVPLKLVAN